MTTINELIKNKKGEVARIIGIAKANYSKIYYIDKKINGCSTVADNGIKHFFWQKDFDNNLVEVSNE